MLASEEWSFVQFHDHNISITLINSWVLGKIYKSRMKDTELKPARRVIQNAVLWMMIAFEYEWWSSSWVFWLNPECPRLFQLSLFSSHSSHHLFSRYILIMPMSLPSECLHPLLSCIRGEAVTIPSILYSWFMGGYSRHQQCRFHSNEDIFSEPNRKDVMSWESFSSSSPQPLEK